MSAGLNENAILNHDIWKNRKKRSIQFHHQVHIHTNILIRKDQQNVHQECILSAFPSTSKGKMGFQICIEYYHALFHLSYCLFYPIWKNKLSYNKNLPLHFLSKTSKTFPVKLREVGSNLNRLCFSFIIDVEYTWKY